MRWHLAPPSSDRMAQGYMPAQSRHITAPAAKLGNSHCRAKPELASVYPFATGQITLVHGAFLLAALRSRVQGVGAPLRENRPRHRLSVPW